MKKKEFKSNDITRRNYLKKSLAGAAGVIFAPTIVPSSVFGKNAPSNQINVGQIGFGRIAMSHDLPETLKHDIASVIAVSELDSNRKMDGKKFIENFYTEKHQKKNYVNVKM